MACSGPVIEPVINHLSRRWRHLRRETWRDELADYSHRMILFTQLNSIAWSPTFEILSVELSKNFKPPKDLLYVLQPKYTLDIDDKTLNYEPEVGDLIVITNVRPISVKDFVSLDVDYHVALVKSVGEDYPGIEILVPKPFLFDKGTHDAANKTQSMYGTYLINLTTNLRIWKALHLDPNGANAGLIKSVLTSVRTVVENCTASSVNKKCSISASYLRAMLHPLNLNDSQTEAVFSCIATRDDSSRKHSVKLIWGPPGTGKTKTVGSLLFVLHRIRCRTLTCAPTNIAVLEVAGRTLKLVRDSLEYGNHGLGDLVLLGNDKRMNVHERDDQIVDIFLSERIKILEECLAPLYGWKDSLKSMIALLEDPENLYRLYLKSRVISEQQDIHKDEEAEMDGKRLQDNNEKGFKNINVRAVKKGKKKKKLKDANAKDLFTNNNGTEDVGNKEDDILSFEAFILKRFISISDKLKFCIVSLYSHLPTSSITLKVVKRMITAREMLESLKTLMHDVYMGNEGIKGIIGTKNKAKGIEGISTDVTLTGLIRMRKIKEECLTTLTFLRDRFSIPSELDKVLVDRGKIVNFCLANASLIFCTVSSSTKLHTGRMKDFELLVIDEAAQLKECESAIPLQLPGIRHAILIGDERQLPATVKSQICEKAEFGRSLFQRLVILGHKKHLLNVQYRMHPSISLFPDKEFYDNEILDAPLVELQSYRRHFLGGIMHGSYSFINISHGQEELGYGHSRKNSVEVAVISELVSQLFKESVSMKRMTSVGIISPYTNNNIGTYFSLSVRSFDGFQGGEEDLIIMSTVRCNDKGSVGFLSNRQRTNVALTRARYCLWVLGNEPTLTSSDTVWRTLVADAKSRQCFYNANEVTRLDRAITNCLVELNRVDILLGIDSPFFRNARWKVCFSDEFRKTMVKTYNIETRRQVFSLLVKLSTGWRNARKESKNNGVTEGNASQLLELYNVHKLLYLAWTVEILKEDSGDVQVLKFWDMVPLRQISKLTQRLDMVFSDYTVDTMYRCKFKSFDERNSEVPMKWSAKQNGGDQKKLPQAKLEQLVGKPIASPATNDKLEESTAYNCRNSEVPMKWSAKLNDGDQKKLPQAKLEQLVSKPIASPAINDKPEESTAYNCVENKKNVKFKVKRSVQATLRNARIPASEAHLGHVINVPAKAIDGRGDITASEPQ